VNRFTGIEDDYWHARTADFPVRNGQNELYGTVIHETTDRGAKTVVGVDNNEDCVALATRTGSGIGDSFVIDYPKIKEQCHRYFTMRKRMREAGSAVSKHVFRDRTQQFTRTLFFDRVRNRSSETNRSVHSRRTHLSRSVFLKINEFRTERCNRAHSTGRGRIRSRQSYRTADTHRVLYSPSPKRS